MRRAQKLWATFYPQRPELDTLSLTVLSKPCFFDSAWNIGSPLTAQLLASEIVKETDHDGNAVISFEEFEPWLARREDCVSKGVRKSAS